jgi:hypothetical protein
MIIFIYVLLMNQHFAILFRKELKGIKISKFVCFNCLFISTVFQSFGFSVGLKRIFFLKGIHLNLTMLE